MNQQTTLEDIVREIEELDVLADKGLIDFEAYLVKRRALAHLQAELQMAQTEASIATIQAAFRKLAH